MDLSNAAFVSSSFSFAIHLSHGKIPNENFGSASLTSCRAFSDPSASITLVGWSSPTTRGVITAGSDALLDRNQWRAFAYVSKTSKFPNFSFLNGSIFAEFSGFAARRKSVAGPRYPLGLVGRLASRKAGRESRHIIRRIPISFFVKSVRFLYCCMSASFSKSANGRVPAAAVENTLRMFRTSCSVSISKRTAAMPMNPTGGPPLARPPLGPLSLYRCTLMEA
mmetsp:Transcript_82402/g.133650  ORF Transcript_82402/g.133650 Transcript_82402/m.133650 type:complete len:223 (-) Transcript_82402:1109-1777(-)